MSPFVMSHLHMFAATRLPKDRRESAAEINLENQFEAVGVHGASVVEVTGQLERSVQWKVPGRAHWMM